MGKFTVLQPIARGTAGVKSLATSILNTIYPPRCLSCGDENAMARGLCAACFSDCHFVSGACCACCGQPLSGPLEPDLRCDECLRYPPIWGQGAAAMVYGGTARRLVLALKHGDRLDLAPPLAALMARAAPDLIASATIVAPIPLHWRRLWARRYNQSAELARHLPLAGAQNCLPDLLVRQRRTVSQDGLNRAQRRENLAGALAVRPKYHGALTGQTVLLIDDVMTTGATLGAAAECCFAAGAANVNILVVARVARQE